MRSTLLSLTILALTLAAPKAFGKATIEKIPCGPANWHERTCYGCKDGDKMYVTVKWVEAAIADAHQPLVGKLADPKQEIEALSAVVGAKATNAKQWTEKGATKPQMTASYCWDAVKAEEIKPLKDKSYGLGAFYADKCRVEADRCYQLTMECNKARGEDKWICNPSLQEFIAKDGKCEDSPVKNKCDCQPSEYFKCGLGGKAAKPAKGGKKKGRR